MKRNLSVKERQRAATNRTFNAFLDHLRSIAKSEYEKGKLFELAIRDYLRQSPEHDFAHVWLWCDWPELNRYGFTKKDDGIDLVAKERGTGKIWAIQCKFYQESSQIDRDRIDSFLSASRGEPFAEHLIITTTYKWGKNAKEILQRQGKNCRVIDPATLETVPFNWFGDGHVERQETRKPPHTYQLSAVAKAKKHFADHERGKLIMACGTGKTYTSLQIVEEITGKHANVLFLAPSISLLSQTLREYAYECQDKQRYVIICSDSKADRDSDGYTVADLPISPTTDASRIADVLRKKVNTRTIVFCTYQSLERIKEAQEQGVPRFDLVVCDEAHRTAGIDSLEKEGNFFTSINNANYVKAAKRLYMTATPRIYANNAKKKADEASIALASMDNEKIFGKEFYRLDFATAIDANLLSDYKVIILTISATYASEHLQEGLVGTDLALEDAAKLIGCYKALRDQGEEDKGIKLGSAVGFVNSIKASKAITASFANVVRSLDAQENDGFTCETQHIDGTDNTIDRNKKLTWLKENAGYTDNKEKICRILMNSKCLTEGIDVPSLDAILFLQPRKSQVDVVQAVGRVMRKKEDKDCGYVILPVVIPEGTDPVAALNDNKTYKVVWQVLNALRSHDKKLEDIIQDSHLNISKPDKIKIIGIGSVCEKAQVSTSDINTGWQYNLADLSEKIFAKMLDPCTDPLYDKKWTSRIAEITKTVSSRINGLLKTNQEIKKKFAKYLQGLKAVINNDIKDEDAMQMLAEHLVTKPAFDRIFKNYKFSDHNPISKSMEAVLVSLDAYGFRNELKDCEKFYDSITDRLERIDNSAGRQKIIEDMYESFIKGAFPKVAEKLGVAYTPVEIVDFILHSVEHVLQHEFKRGLSDKGVHIIDPFVGTGTFIARLLQIKELIKDDDLIYKYRNEIHANEILLLPYYIASINIEAAFHSRIGGDYQPFNGIAFTDTFNLDEQADNKVVPIFQANNQRIARQKATDITVVVMNPPYSVGQKSENDANKNTVHPCLRKRVQDTYMTESDAVLKRALLDSYIKAIRWASDRIVKNGGVIGFVHNASLLDERSTQGLRRCLVEEFDTIHSFNLRGNARTKGEDRKKEKDNVFGQNSRTPVAITFLVKTAQAKNKKTKIHYHDIGDYLSREEKLTKISDYSSIANIKWQAIIPSKHGDWINQRDESYEQLPVLGDKKRGGGIFELYSLGVVTNRDSWAYNYDHDMVATNMVEMIGVYNYELARLAGEQLTVKNIDQHIELNEKKIKWSYGVKDSLIKGKEATFTSDKIALSSYRPFTKKHLYYCTMFNERHYQTSKIFPIPDNLWLCVSGIGAKEFSVLMTDTLPNLDFIEKSQCFPRFYLDDNGKQQEGISDEALHMWQKHYGNSKINKEQLFYYIYGMLHAEDYRTKYRHNLTKELPCIPFAADFKLFVDTGRALADLHLGYENQPQLANVKILYREQETCLKHIPPESLRVTKKMKIAKDQCSIIYNDDITITGIPAESWQHKINGYSPTKWIVERYYRKIDPKTDLLDDPNSYSDDPRYVLRLLISTITVGVETKRLAGKLNLEGTGHKKAA